MRPVSSQGVSDYLDTNTEGAPAHLITITLVNGHVERYTDWEASLAWGGVDYPAGATLKRPVVAVGEDGTIRKESVGTEIGEFHVSLLCDTRSEINGKKIPLAAVDGDFSGAWVHVDRACLDGTASVLGTTPLWDGPVSEAAPTSTRVDVTVDSGMGLLTKQMPPRTYQAGCTHTLYDAGCALVKATYTVTGTVASGSTVSVVQSNLTSQGSNYFALGVLTFTTGALAGVQRGVRYSALGALSLDRPLKSVPAAGDTFTVYPGCDKTRSTCLAKFSNMAHFAGQPLVPKNEQGRLG